MGTKEIKRLKYKVNIALSRRYLDRIARGGYRCCLVWFLKKEWFLTVTKRNGLAYNANSPNRSCVRQCDFCHKVFLASSFARALPEKLSYFVKRRVLAKISKLLNIQINSLHTKTQTHTRTSPCRSSKTYRPHSLYPHHTNSTMSDVGLMDSWKARGINFRTRESRSENSWKQTNNCVLRTI